MQFQSQIEINTPCGSVRGIQHADGKVFYGIPYAHAGRWKYPKQVRQWDGIVVADTQPPLCYQPEQGAQGRTEFSEDCQYLNVFCPTDAEHAPVVVFIHGGNFVYGGLSCRDVQLTKWAKQGVVSVAVGYRLGCLGFAADPELMAESGRCGNYGLYDILAALGWIHDNIAAFGGDPNRVTLVGQSAGAIAADYLCTSELAAGLVHQAVLLSGGTHRIGSHSVRLEDAYPFWSGIRHRCGADSLSAWRKTSPHQLISAFEEARDLYPIRKTMAWYHPLPDGFLIPYYQASEEIPRNPNIRYLVGATQYDMFPDLFLQELHEWQKTVPHVYACLFAQDCKGVEHSATHDSDLPYWLGTMSKGDYLPQDEELSGRMIQYLCNFVKYGDPNGEQLPYWDSNGIHMLRL